MKKKLDCYLVSYRRRWGFTQPELSFLLGHRSASVVSRLELGLRQPSLETAFAFEVIFGVPAAELFPSLFDSTEEEVLTRAYDLYERFQDDPSKVARLKFQILKEAFERAKARDSHNGV
jgi:transcriptional regulator with XRE-family HTH domain